MHRIAVVAMVLAIVVSGSACTSGSSQTSVPPVTSSLPGPSERSHPPTHPSGPSFSPSPVPSDGFVRRYPNPFMPAPPSSPSGLVGSVYGGPACAFRLPACDQPPVHLRGTVTVSGADRPLLETRTDRSGHYLVAEPPGAVLVEFRLAQALTEFSCPRGPFRVTIPDGRYAGVDFVCIQH